MTATVLALPLPVVCCPLCKGQRKPPLRGRIFGSFLGCPCCEGKGRVERKRAEFFLYPECPF